ncbi:hypothetical protein BD324DRAFT_263199 [Kockovaella imperatae]|uniref:Cytochrome b561 domain-containing protein n=1 Tax=Kockovaella imperatae TaxID=4999 RepID=A0A1Y1UQ28_9TREE|nr:hypothetical protein BD324DRAFT_263199 [Kockovaella imperatae]ORX40168.1 hypothetical protein BD324DRAFT_263199 [Kockovaella imperatae]
MRGLLYTSLGLVVSALNVAGSSFTGQKQCDSNICITGLRDSSNGTQTWTLAGPEGKDLGSSQVGWMAIGFGTKMANSQMVILWPNSDGSITMSQRNATGHNMPKVVQSPPRAANLMKSESFSNSTSTSFTFTIPSSSDSDANNTQLIYAMSDHNPGSSSPSANIVQHNKNGNMQFNLLATYNPNEGNSGSSSSSSSSSPSTAVYAHAAFGALAAMLFLPLGALVPRWARAFTVKRWWFPAHGALNGILGLTCVVVAFAIAAASFDDGVLGSTHTKCGLALLILVIFQSLLGSATHWLKHRLIEKSKIAWRRGPLNFVHMITGIAIIALGWVTVYQGLFSMWSSSYDSAPGNGWKIAFWVLMAVPAALYVIGLAFIPRQLKLEHELHNGTTKEIGTPTEEKGRTSIGRRFSPAA